jgi:hypothetical protein
VVVEEYDDPKARTGAGVSTPTGLDQLAPIPRLENETGAQLEEEAEHPASSGGSLPTPPSSRFGRTLADLYHDATSDVRLTSTLLFFVPFPFFAAKIDKLEDLIVPSVLGVLLNIIWHGVAFVSAHRRRSG